MSAEQADYLLEGMVSGSLIPMPYHGTINSKINGTPKGVYLPISRLKSSVNLKWASNHTWGVPIILQLTCCLVVKKI